MKTVLITSFHNFTARNVLVAPFFQLLQKEKNIRIVLVVPEGKASFYEKSFGGEQVVVHGVSGRLRRIDAFFKDLAFASMRTSSLKLMRRYNVGLERPWAHRFLFWAPLVRNIIPFLYAHLMPRRSYADIFETYHPSLLLSTDIFSAVDNRLMHEARLRKIKILGMVRSWDNLTTKGPLRVIPDVLVVQNEIQKEEGLSEHRVPAERIVVVGIPFHDRYVRGPIHTRDVFLEAIGADPAKKVITYSAIGDRHFRHNTFDRDMIEILAAILPETHELLVRFPPADAVTIDDVRTPRKVLFERPGAHLHARKDIYNRNELGPEDDDHLIDTIYYSDMIIGLASTLLLDAALCDRPIIMIAFMSQDRVYKRSGVVGAFEYVHVKKFVETRAAQVVHTPDELRKAIMEYLENPRKDAKGRERARREQGFQYDGHASERLLDVVCDMLGAR